MGNVPSGKKMKAKSSNMMIAAGLIVILLGAWIAWYLYRMNYSPLDVVDTSLKSLDQSNNYIPMVQPEDNQKAPTIAGEDNVNPTVTPQFSGTSGAVSEQPLAAESPTPITGMIPDRVVIPAIFLDAPIVPIHYKTVEYLDQTLQQWLAPNQFAAGWQDTSALLGLPGNTVLNGHHNAFGMVFKDLLKLEVGDIIQVYSGSQVFNYKVEERMLLPERYQPLEVRIANARWVMPSDDERLTMITCWPATGNSDRVVIVAFPVHQ
jgi:LPXTG-site transpeptidase (sortase) family protein